MPSFLSVCARRKCPQLRPRSVQRCPGIELIQAASWFFTGRNLVTGDSAGFLLLTTRPTREGKSPRGRFDFVLPVDALSTAPPGRGVK
jgi:hypothetical protein